ncbi:MAG TPA: hypothetical protein VII56_09720 [Rhizomicrobium sp.]
MAKAGSASAVADLFTKDLLLSIKPEYAIAIVDGRKTVELRRKFPEDVAGGSKAFIYSSSPVQAVVAFAVIERVDRLALERLWQRHGKASCVDRATFDAYFLGQSIGCGVVLRSITSLANPIPREDLKSRFGILPPQSFMYLPADVEKQLFDGDP